jgi:hypothetical protein
MRRPNLDQMRGAFPRIKKNLGIFKRKGAARSKEMPLSAPMAITSPGRESRARRALARDPVQLGRIAPGSTRFSGTSRP